MSELPLRENLPNNESEKLGPQGLSDLESGEQVSEISRIRERAKEKYTESEIDSEKHKEYLRQHGFRTSEIEYDAENIFQGMRIGSDEEFDRVASEIFSEVCGGYGKKEFFETTLPAIRKVYGSNYRSAGVRLLEIIDKGSALKPDEIGDFLKTAISGRELKFSEKSREEILKGIVDTINNLILENKEKYGERYEGVIAAVIYGSYAKNNFSLKSDLDILYITESSEEGRYFRVEDRYVDYISDFEISLQRRIKPPLENFLGSIAINDKDGLTKAKDDLQIKEANIIVCPYPKIRKELEAILCQ